MAPLRVFISHASADTAFAERLAGDLRSAGADVWIDATHLLGTGGDFLARISRALADRDVFVLVLSPSAIASHWVPDEMNAAIIQYKDGFMQAPIVVVAEPVSGRDIPGLWKIYNRIDATGDYEASLRLVLTALKLVSPISEVPMLPKVLPAESSPAPTIQIAPAPPSPPVTADTLPHTVTKDIPTSSRRLLSPKLAAPVVLLLIGIILLCNLGRIFGSSSSDHGSEQWKFQTGGEVVDAPVVANGIVYIGSYDNYMYALDAKDGSVRWKYQGSRRWSGTPVIANGIVYVGSDNNYLYALDALNGSVRWQVEIGSKGASSSAVVANGVVYVGSWDNYVYALNGADGTVRWKFKTGDTVGTLAVANGTVYVGSMDQSVYALDAVRGSLQWKVGFLSFDWVQAVAGDLVYAVVGYGCGDTVDYDHDCIYALDASNGSVRWKFQTGAYAGLSPVVSNGKIYVGSTGDAFYALDASNGSVRWESTDVGDASGSPWAANSAVYVGSSDHYVYALATTDGSLIWKFQTGDEAGSASVTNGVVYVGSRDHYVYAIHA